VIEQTAARRERELDAVDPSRLRSYDGLILSAVQLHDDDAMLLHSDFPVVVLGERSYSAPLDRVVMANEQGAAMAAEHLIDVGCTRLAMIGGRSGAPDDIGVETLRARGFVDAAQGRGVEIRPELIRGGEYSYEGGHRAMSQLLDEGETVDGIFCATDVIAIGAIRALVERGLRVPSDVCVVGFDDVPLASFLTPSLTTMSPDHAAMADAAITMLVDRITGQRAPDQFETVVGAVTLKQRETTTR
jgi:DNA-binding LacI/PurR family transcriptional regulator